MNQVKTCLQVDEREAERIAKASTVRFGPMLFEVLRFPLIKRRIADYVRIEGLEKLQQCLSDGKGAVIAAAHSGNWELMGGAFAMAGIPLVGVAMKQKSSGSDRFINEYRSLIGMHITYKTGVREMFDMLKKGWAIGLIMDQDTNRHDGILLDFFGATKKNEDCAQSSFTKLARSRTSETTFCTFSESSTISFSTKILLKASATSSSDLL